MVMPMRSRTKRWTGGQTFKSMTFSKNQKITIVGIAISTLLTVIGLFFGSKNNEQKNVQTMTNSPGSTQTQINAPVTINENFPEIVYQEKISYDVPQDGKFAQIFRFLVTQSSHPPTFLLLNPKIEIESPHIQNTSTSIVSGAPGVPNGQYDEYYLSFLTPHKIEQTSLTFGVR